MPITISILNQVEVFRWGGGAWEKCQRQRWVWFYLANLIMIGKKEKHIKITDYTKLTGGVNTNEGKQKDKKNLEHK